MTPQALLQYLSQLVSAEIKLSTMIWGPPGVGKSSLVRQTAEANGLEFVDVRLSQLAPTDLRGLPVAVAGGDGEGVSRWYPPEFLPRGGRGVLFLDELNMAPPTMQGMAQQLILDRRVGNYRLPEGWFVWAAGNRKEDRAAVFDMPAPLANRFVHLALEPNLDDFKAYGLATGVHEDILGFLSFRPALLHHLDPRQPAWPSPRSWVMASRLHGAGLAVSSVVGEGAAAEFDAYVALSAALPDLEPVLEGRGDAVPFPEEPSARYAATMSLAVRASGVAQAVRAFDWLAQKAGDEWVQLFALDLVGRMRARGELGTLAGLVDREPRLREYLERFVSRLGEG